MPRWSVATAIASDVPIAGDVPVAGAPRQLDVGTVRAGLAAVTSPAAVPLDQAERPNRAALVLGAEGDGLTEEVQAACTRHLTIPMAPGSDSI